MPPPPGVQRLFVYGTLRRGSGAQHLLARASLQGPATVRGRLLLGPGYPALILEGDDPVHGEIWTCDAETLAELDRYEGVQEDLFRRVLTEIEGAPAWVYVAGDRLRDSGLPTIPGGDWIAWSTGESGAV